MDRVSGCTSFQIDIVPRTVTTKQVSKKRRMHRTCWHLILSHGWLESCSSRACPAGYIGCFREYDIPFHSLLPRGSRHSRRRYLQLAWVLLCCSVVHTLFACGAPSTCCCLAKKHPRRSTSFNDSYTEKSDMCFLPQWGVHHHHHCCLLVVGAVFHYCCFAVEIIDESINTHWRRSRMTSSSYY